jgi:DNA-directed RNA polymerase subunit beta'
MAVHLPLSAEAQAEARILMLSANNILSPATGRPIVTPTQDMVFGAYYLTLVKPGAPGEGRVFRHLHEVERAYEAGDLDLHALIKWRPPVEGLDGPSEVHPDGTDFADGWVSSPDNEVETTAGRIIFNTALPDDFEFVNDVVGKRNRSIGSIVEVLAERYPRVVVATSLDRIKDLCFRYAARSGLTISIDDVKTPPSKGDIIARYEGEAEKAETQFKRGIITDDERRQKEIEIWTAANSEIGRAMEQTLAETKFNPLDMMVDSGARGNPQQVRQIAGMKGLVSNPRGEMIPRPIRASFREGLSVLEYFISTHGARKGLADTALRTADSGYLTRRLVDVAQELIVRIEDCGTTRGIRIDTIQADDDKVRAYLETRIDGRVLARDVELADGTVIEAGTMISPQVMVTLRDDPAVSEITARSVLTCEAEHGVCGSCYGRSLATNREIELGEAVGVIAAQSIGEPGTQLTMRTFHQGGIAGEDITHGLPRVVELFEARTPKGAAILARVSGVVRIDEEDAARRIVVVADDGTEDVYAVHPRAKLADGIVDGAEITAGEPIVDGPKDPKQLLEIRGIRETQQYLVNEVQQVYRDQGVSIHDKHIELIVRQMLRRVLVADQGESPFLPGERVDSRTYADVNRRLVTEGKRPAEGRPELMGITKASLATDSWLSAASFQETTRVLTEAAIEGKSDHLFGLKENIIIGKLIPAGTGMIRYRSLVLEAPEAERMTFWSSGADEESGEDLAAWLASIGSDDESEVLGFDSGEFDTGALDTGALDTGALDTGALDSGGLGTGSLATGPLEVGPFEAGPGALEGGGGALVGFADRTDGEGDPFEAGFGDSGHESSAS